MDFETSEVIQVIGGSNKSNEGKFFTVVSHDATFTKWKVSGDVVTNDSGQGWAQRFIGQVQAEKDEAFLTIENLYSPETAYNLIFSPRRIVYNWAPFLNIGLVKKDATDVILTTFMKQNSKLKSTLSPLDPRRRYEPFGELEEVENATLATFKGDVRAPLHSNEFSFFKAPMSFTDYKYILDRLAGRAQDENDRGYLVYPDDEGNMLKGFVYDAKYQPVDEIAEFQIAIIGIYN